MKKAHLAYLLLQPPARSLAIAHGGGAVINNFPIFFHTFVVVVVASLTFLSTAHSTKQQHEQIKFFSSSKSICTHLKTCHSIFYTSGGCCMRCR